MRGSRLGCELGYEGIIWHQWVSGVRVGLGCAGIVSIAWQK